MWILQEVFRLPEVLREVCLVQMRNDVVVFSYRVDGEA
jgi:hypothetical protein